MEISSFGGVRGFFWERVGVVLWFSRFDDFGFVIGFSFVGGCFYLSVGV